MLEEEEQCDVCTQFILEYKTCDGCGDILCDDCAFNLEGIAFCEECYMGYEEEQERDDA